MVTKRTKSPNPIRQSHQGNTLRLTALSSDSY